MKIVQPNVQLSKVDRQLIVFISRIILEAADGNYGENFPKDSVMLSEADAETLLVLLTELLDRKEFHEKMAFVSSVGFFHDDNDKWRKLYFQKSGKAPIHSTQKWLEFRQRLGHQVEAYIRGRAPKYMEFDYFMQMEKGLFDAIGLSPRVSDVLTKFVYLQRSEVEAIRVDKRGGVNLITKGFRPIMRCLQNKYIAKGGIAISSQKLCGIATVVANTGVYFSTRDWGVAGTISTMAGGLAMIGGNDD